MVAIWSRSDTFAHGFLILPISIWLVWTRRDLLEPVKPQPALWVALLIIPLDLAWLVAWLVDVAVIQQLALVAMIGTGAWAIMGHQLARVLAFPLFFLFFAVPMGEGLVAPMMEFTATSVIWMIEMTGIPVFREGLIFSLPTGHWSVVEACSGVRYIIASVTVGTLYAYLTYRSWSRRAIFVLVSAIVPVFANTVRGYIIVMLGHMSDMTIATGADHLIYGWVFFALVIFVLFWIGSFFREDQEPPAAAQPEKVMQQGAGAGANRMLLVTVFSALLIASAAPFIAYGTLATGASQAQRSVTLPAGLDDREPRLASRWRPPSRVSGQQLAYYALDGEPLALYVQFADETLGGEDVIGSSTLFSGQNGNVRVIAREKVSARLLGKEIVVDEAQLRTAEGELLVWSWYLIGNISTSNNYLAKLQQAGAKLGIADKGAYRIVVATPFLASFPISRARLQAFLDQYAPPLYEQLHQPGLILP